MTTATNGHGGPPPSRRVHPDQFRRRAQRYSGRRVVAVFGLTVVLLWGGLKLAHRGWAARHRALAEFGATQVARQVEPLLERSPPDWPAGAWESLVGDTRRMLEVATASGAQDRAALEGLRTDVAGRVAAARPETAVAVVARLWADMDRTAGPALLRAPRPERLALARIVSPLGRGTPPGVEPAAWERALEATRLLLVDLAIAGRWSPRAREQWRRRWEDRVARASMTEAVGLLRGLWDEAEARGATAPGRQERPWVLTGTPTP